MGPVALSVLMSPLSRALCLLLTHTIRLIEKRAPIKASIKYKINYQQTITRTFKNFFTKEKRFFFPPRSSRLHHLGGQKNKRASHVCRAKG